MATDITLHNRSTEAAVTFSEDKIELLKRTVAANTTNDEFALFAHVAQRTGLDPFARQIYAIKRGGKLTIQTGIDGYRLIADRTGCYAPGREPSFGYDEGLLVSATAYVKKLVAGQWHEVAATAFWAEYFPGDQQGPMWKKMPHTMLAKCAEALALRRAFPAELSGVYTREEMEQAEAPATVMQAEPLATDEQRELIRKLIKSHVVTADEREAMERACANGLTKARASAAIERLMAEIKARKAAEAEEQEQTEDAAA